MAGRFWFGKKNISSDSQGADGVDSASSGGAVVMTDAVFPTGFGDEEDDVPVSSSANVSEKLKQDVEATKKKVANQKLTMQNNGEFRESAPGGEKVSSNVPVAENKEVSVNFADNRGKPTFKTVSIPGVVDGGRPDGKPVMTPVRMALSTAPIKLKSLTDVAKENPEKAQVSADNAPAAAALKVINKDPAVEVNVTAQPKFNLKMRKNEEPAKPVNASIASTSTESYAPSDIVKPKSDQRVLYYQLMNGLYDTILVLDDDGHVVDCNERVKKVLGYSREETWDLPIEKVIKGMNPQMFAHLKKNLEENHNVLITARCYKCNGDSFKGEIGVSTLSLTRASNVVFAIRNVDQRKSTMAELRKAAAAFDISLASTFACNSEGFFTNVNKALIEAFGILDAKQAQSIRFVDILPAGARSFTKALSGEELREKLTVTDAEGHPVNVELALAPIKVGSDVIGVAGSMLPL